MQPLSHSPPHTAGWPRWLVVLASVLILYHLGSVVLGALAAPSGPWPTGEGASMALPPPAAAMAYESVAQPYLRATKLTHNAHFTSNRVGGPDAYLEVRLLDEAGELIHIARVPDPDAPPLIRQRQTLLIRGLVDDQPVAPPPAERIYPPGQTPPRIRIWDIVEPQRLALTEISELEVPRNRPVFRPTEWSLVVVRSCARHLCRQHGAAQARVIRHSRDAITPEILMMPQARPNVEELICDYGRISP